jgi:4-carboxymuconolactone decarboxylase
MSEATQEWHGRVQWFRPDELDEDARELYDAITSGPRAAGPRNSSLTGASGQLAGPFNAMLLTPRLGNALQALGAAVRYQTSLGARARELAILSVARDAKSDFEWNAHATIGYAAGLTIEEVTALFEGREIPTLSDNEQWVVRVVRTLLDRRDLTDAEFAEANDALGRETLMELIVLVGYYNTLALSMRVWRVPLAEGMEQIF